MPKIARYHEWILSLLLWASPALAVQMIPLEIEDMAARSDLIVHATVLDKACERSPEGRIFTRVQLEALEIWKGALTTNRFTVVHGGGTLGNVRTEISGQVEYETGEEVVAFLVLNARGEAVTLGLAQGKFRVWKEPATGEKFAHNNFHGATAQEAARNSKASKLALKQLRRLAKGGEK